MAVERPYSEILELVHSPVFTGVFVGVRESKNASGLRVGVIISSGDNEADVVDKVESDRAQNLNTEDIYHILFPGDPRTGRPARMIGGTE